MLNGSTRMSNPSLGEVAGNFDRLHDKEPELLQDERFDSKRAGIRLLGRDMAKYIRLPLSVHTPLLLIAQER